MLCKVLEISRSGFYSWLLNGKSMKQKEDEKLIPLVKMIHRISDETYGSRRMSEELTAHGIPCGKIRAGTLMKLAGVSVKNKKKFRVTTDSKHNLPIAPNLLNREFNVSKPNQVWCADITYIWTHEGWMYLAVVMDLYNRQIIGRAMSNRINKKLVIKALRMAIVRRNPLPGLICHSDRGSQYCSKSYQKLLKAYDMKCSMSKKGDCWDNAVVESFFATLKKERVFHKKYFTRNQCCKDVTSYIEGFYNSIRRHSHLGYMSPIQFEMQRSLENAA